MSKDTVGMLDLTPTSTVGDLLSQVIQGAIKTGNSKAEFDINGEMDSKPIVANFQITLRPQAVN